MANIDVWRARLQQRGVEFEDSLWPGVVAILAGTIANHLQGIDSLENFDTAAKVQWAVLRNSFKPGKAMPDPRAAEKDRADRLKKKEQMNALGMGGHKTELDRDDAKDDKAKTDAAKRVQLTQEQLEAKEEFAHICNIYSCTRAGRTDHAKTGERREKLRQIIVKKGDRILYTAMLEEANEMLRRFESEDSRRIY